MVMSENNKDVSNHKTVSETNEKENEDNKTMDDRAENVNLDDRTENDDIQDVDKELTNDKAKKINLDDRTESDISQDIDRKIANERIKNANLTDKTESDNIQDVDRFSVSSESGTTGEQLLVMESGDGNIDVSSSEKDYIKKVLDNSDFGISERSDGTMLSKTESEEKYINDIFNKKNLSIDDISTNTSILIPENEDAEIKNIEKKDNMDSSMSINSDNFVKCVNCCDVIRLPAKNIMYCGLCQHRLEDNLHQEDSGFVLREVCEPCSECLSQNKNVSNFPEKMVLVDESNGEFNQDDKLADKLNMENEAMKDLFLEQEEIKNEKKHEEVAEQIIKDKLKGVDNNVLQQSKEEEKEVSAPKELERDWKIKQSFLNAVNESSSKQEIEFEEPQTPLPSEKEFPIYIKVEDESSLGSFDRLGVKMIGEPLNPLIILDESSMKNKEEIEISSVTESTLKSTFEKLENVEKLIDTVKLEEISSESEYTNHSFHKLDLPIIKDTSEINLDESTESEKISSVSTKTEETEEFKQKPCNIKVKMIIDDKSVSSFESIDKAKTKLVGEDTSYGSDSFKIPPGTAFNLSDSFGDDKVDSSIISIPTGIDEFTVELEDSMKLDLPSSSSIASENMRIYKFKIEREKLYEKENEICKGKVKNLINHFEKLSKK
ncbi:hypothetical protein SLOPH_2178 [Spraguea lophii 42_110]|uniref:Uncharacterized protein n=1 Tax=Spraguea lophii (strain 42_110) TaxID=1358809 RepID=S7W8B4_SPRLO|nr:hypothetical protein SLOPH_2178 [Spraguea lophii 42_110]